MLMGKTLNGNVMCSIGIREVDNKMFNLCIIPLNLDYNPVMGKMFDKLIQVDSSRLKVEDRVFARSPLQVWDQFEQWFDEKIKGGQIIPLVYDWPRVREHFVDLISEPGCKLAFIERARDIKAIAEYLNDRSEFDGNQIPFSKTNLRYVLRNCGFPLEPKYTALDASIKISQSYKHMLDFPL